MEKPVGTAHIVLENKVQKRKKETHKESGEVLGKGGCCQEFLNIFFNILYYRKLYLFVNIEIDSLHIYICVYICTALPSGKISEISKRQKLHGEANTKSHSLE